MTALPSDSELLDLSCEICSIWTNIGTRLGLPRYTLNIITGTPSHDTTQKKAFEMLITWRQRQTTPSCVAELVDALKKEGREDLAQNCCKWQVRYSCFCVISPQRVHTVYTCKQNFFDTAIHGGHYWWGTSRLRSSGLFLMAGEWWPSQKKKAAYWARYFIIFIEQYLFWGGMMYRIYCLCGEGGGGVGLGGLWLHNFGHNWSKKA